MFRVFAAPFAIFFEHDFFGRVDLISTGDVVLGFAHGADECEDEPLTLFCHSRGIIAQNQLLLKQSVSDYGAGDRL